jgi:hypothetical protein
VDIKITTKLPFYSIGFVGLFLAFFLQEVSAQSRIVVLKEQQSQQTIPYANVIFDNSGFGTYSNHLGVFTVPETIQSLRISAIGFEPQLIHVKELSPKDTSSIFLELATYSFETITVEAKPYQEKILGYELLPMPLNRIRYASWSNFGSSIAIRLDFPEYESPHFIKKLEIALYDNPFDSTLIRFSLKKVDDRGYPGKMIYQSPVIINYDKTNRWISHTLEKDLFLVSEPSLFLVVENFMPETDTFSLLKPKFSFLFHHRKKPKSPIYLSNPELKKWYYSRKQVVYRVTFLTE